MSQNTTPFVYTGLDISKLNLQLFVADQLLDLPNTPDGFRQLCHKLAALPAVHVICEATGGYERDVVAALHNACLPVSVINPARVRHFARACGQRAKTDALDASVLAAYGKALAPAPTLPRSQAELELTELIRRRAQLLDILTSQRLQREGLRLPVLRAQAKTLIANLEKQVEKIEAQLQALRQQEVQLDQKIQKLDAIASVGALTAMVVLAEMPELGTLGRRQAAALAGLAPHPRQSGQWEGRRNIGGGRPTVRKALYMAALVACRFNSRLREFYTRLRKAGKPAKVALTAVMRKLIVLMNQILKNPDFALEN